MLSQPVRRIDHVAVVVESLEGSLAFYRDLLGIAPSRVLDFPSEGVRIAYLPLGGAGGTEIELLEPADPATGVARFLQRHGQGLHHICLEVTDIALALDELIAAGAAVIDAAPRQTAEGQGIFLHPRGTSGVLLELVQRDMQAPT
jgi:methylmalonyl-CoA epimerase